MAAPDVVGKVRAALYRAAWEVCTARSHPARIRSPCKAHGGGREVSAAHACSPAPRRATSTLPPLPPPPPAACCLHLAPS